MVIGLEELTEKKFFKFANSRKRLFTSIVWMEGMLAIADEEGFLYFAEMNS